MEITTPTLSILLSFLLSTLILLKLESRLRSKRSSENPPPGPWKLPLIGNMHNLIGSLPHQALHKLAKNYGPLMQLQLGEISVVVVSSADAAKEVMKTHDINFASRPPLLASEIMQYGCTSISFSPYGDYWRQLRKICMLELLSVKRVHSLRSLREKVYLDFTKWIASVEGSPINLTDKLYTSAYSFTVTAALGKMTKERESLLPIIKESIELSAGFNIAEVYPSVKLFRRMSGLGRRLTGLHKIADKIFEGIIQDHKDGTNHGDYDQEDLLDVLLRIQDDGLEVPITTDNIKAVLVDILAGGSETSATVMDWVMAEMMKNPRVLEKAQDEVRRLFDEKGYVEESRIHELKYMKAVVKETMRLHPPLSLLLPRKCGQTCRINGYEIAEETKIIVNAWAINRDPNYWNNADNFQPERFVDSLVDYKGNHFEYIPFGAGRRICPGMSFGLANVELPLAMFLYHFDWKLAHGIHHQDMDMTEGFGMTTRREKDLCVVPVVKRPLPLK